MTKLFSQLSTDDTGMTLVYLDGRRRHRVKLLRLDEKRTHNVAYVQTASAGQQVLTLSNDTVITLEP